MKTCKINFLIFVCIFAVIIDEIKSQDEFYFPDDPILTERYWLSTPPPFQFNQPIRTTKQARLPSRTRTPTPTPTTPSRTPAPTPTQTSTTAAARTTPTPEFIQCMKNCPTTTQYNPVCGNDRIIYFNEQRLFCAQMCGSSVQMAGRGNCASLFGSALGTW